MQILHTCTSSESKVAEHALPCPFLMNQKVWSREQTQKVDFRIA